MKITKRQLNKIIMEELTSLLNLQEEKSAEDLESPKLKGGTVADVKVGLGKKDQKRLDDKEDQKTGKVAGGTSGAAEAPRQDENLDLEESEQLDERETSAGQARTDDRHKSHGRGQDEGPGGAPLEEAGADRLRSPGGVGQLASADVNVGLGKKPAKRLPDYKATIQQRVKDKTFLGSVESPDELAAGDSTAKLDKAFDDLKENVLTKEEFQRAKATIKEALKAAMR